ncbi:MAG: hypothetical protein ACLQQ4_07670 [Bacteroidia bacterium]
MKKIILIAIVSLLSSSTSFAKRSFADTAKHDTIFVRDGSSFEKAVIIEDTTESEGISAEYKWLAIHYPGYRTDSQALAEHDKHPFDILSIKTADGIPKDVYFDISNYFGKW